MAFGKRSAAAVGERARADRGGDLAGRVGKRGLVQSPRPGSWRYEAYKKLADEVRLATKEAMDVEYIEEQREVIARLVVGIQKLLGERHPLTRFIEGDLNDPLVLVSVKTRELVPYLDDVELLKEWPFVWPTPVDVDPADPCFDLMVAFGHLVLLVVRAEGNA